jgi:hypothetical protein
VDLSIYNQLDPVSKAIGTGGIVGFAAYAVTAGLRSLPDGASWANQSRRISNKVIGVLAGGVTALSMLGATPDLSETVTILLRGLPATGLGGVAGGIVSWLHYRATTEHADRGTEDRRIRRGLLIGAAAGTLLNYLAATQR